MVTPQVLPVGAALTDHLIPPSSGIEELQEETSLDEVSAPIGLGSTLSLPVAALLELGEAALPDVVPSKMNSSSVHDCDDDESEDTLSTTSSLPNENVCGVTGTERRLVPRNKANSSPDDNENLRDASEKDLARLFGLASADSLKGMVNVVAVNKGDLLSKELELQAELYYIITGRLHVIQTTTTQNQAAVCIFVSFISSSCFICFATN